MPGRFVAARYGRVMTSDPNAVYEAILGLRRGGKAVVLLTYRGDW